MSKVLNKGLKIVYPPNCKEVSDDIGKDELVRRLKSLARAFQDMGQEDNEQYTGLALYLATEYFMDHSNKDVRLLAACCIADSFRIFAPEAPYREPDLLKDIFMFFIKQLRGLEDPTSPAFKRYFYLLENLAWVKSFNICIELDDNQEIFCALFKLMFAIVNDKHTLKLFSFMLDMMSPLITEADMVSQELLDIILINIVEPNKSENKHAYSLSKELLKRCSTDIEPYIQVFFNNALMLGKNSQSEMSLHLYELIHELNNIAPIILLAVLPQLEFKLKSNEERERKAVTRILAKMFSEPNSELAYQNKPLWNCFLGRFNDISNSVRTSCVQYAQYFILFHPRLTREVTEQLKSRQHDPEEIVRVEVVNTILHAARKDFLMVSDELLTIIKERTLDKKFKIRREALLGLAGIYKKIHMKDPLDVKDANRVAWVRDKVFHNYYQQSIEDRLLVERVFNTCLVPYTLPSLERMKRLYLMYATLDDHAVKAFIELLKHQRSVRSLVQQLIDIIETDRGEKPLTAAMVNPKLIALAKNLCDPSKSITHLRKFTEILVDGRALRQYVKTLLSAECSCKKAEDAVNEILKKLGNPSPQNMFYATVKSLLERIAPVMIDSNAINMLAVLVEQTIRGLGDIAETLPNAGEKGMQLLLALSQVYSHCFCTGELFTLLLTFLKHEDDSIVDVALQIIANTGHKLQETCPTIYSSLLPVLTSAAKMGSPKQAKHALRCISGICNNKDVVFKQIFEHVKKSLDPDQANYLTSIVSLGHITQACPDEFAAEMKSIISKTIVKDLLMQDVTQGIATTESWYANHMVTEETQAKIQAIKLLVRWLLGMKDNAPTSGTSTLRLLHTMIIHDGDLMEKGFINKPELARLRLQAGCSILKLAEETCFADMISREQFQALALLINDSCYEVRLNFALKLHKGLITTKLPLEYMGIFSLAANDPLKDRRVQVKQFLQNNINKRRDYLKQHATSEGVKMFNILPDYVLPYAIHLLAHDPDLQTHDDLEALKNIKECLWFIMEPLMNRNEDYNFNFFRNMIENIKQTKDQQGPDDEEMNKKLYSVCDIALGLVMTKTTNFLLKDSVIQPVLPAKLFTAPDQNYTNTQVYLPKDFHFDQPKVKGISAMVPGMSNTGPSSSATEVTYSVNTNRVGPFRMYKPQPPIITTTIMVESPGPVINVLPTARLPKEKKIDQAAKRRAKRKGGNGGEGEAGDKPVIKKERKKMPDDGTSGDASSQKATPGSSSSLEKKSRARPRKQLAKGKATDVDSEVSERFSEGGQKSKKSVVIKQEAQEDQDSTDNTHISPEVVKKSDNSKQSTKQVNIKQEPKVAEKGKKSTKTTSVKQTSNDSAKTTVISGKKKVTSSESSQETSSQSSSKSGLSSVVKNSQDTAKRKSTGGKDKDVSTTSSDCKLNDLNQESMPLKKRGRSRKVDSDTEQDSQQTLSSDSASKPVGNVSKKRLLSGDSQECTSTKRPRGKVNEESLDGSASPKRVRVPTEKMKQQQEAKSKSPSSESTSSSAKSSPRKSSQSSSPSLSPTPSLEKKVTVSKTKVMRTESESGSSGKKAASATTSMAARKTDINQPKITEALAKKPATTATAQSKGNVRRARLMANGTSDGESPMSSSDTPVSSESPSKAEALSRAIQLAGIEAEDEEQDRHQRVRTRRK